MTLKLCMKYFLCEYYQGCSNYDPFYAKVKFGHIGFCMGKSENYYFFFLGGGGGGEGKQLQPYVSKLLEKFN